MSAFNHPKTPCPQCKANLDATLNADSRPGNPAPTAGDWTVCGYCAFPLQFDAELRLVPLTQGEIWTATSADRRRLAEAIRMARLVLKEAKGSDYARHIQKMIAAAATWKAANPTAVPILQVRVPRTTWLAMTIRSALQQGLVAANPDALDVISAMEAVEPDPQRAPTVGMVRAALDDAGVAAWR